MKRNHTLPNNYPAKLKANFLARLAKYKLPGMKDECWEWQGAKAFYNYGTISYYGALYRTHRVAWETWRGIIPLDKFVLHHCDNPPCCNPAHLFLGDQAANNRDRDAKGRGNQPHSHNHHKSQLTARQVIKIKELYFSGEMNQYQLAAKFGIKQPNISRLVRGLRYRQLKNGKPIPLQSIKSMDYRHTKGKVKYSPTLKTQAKKLYKQGKRMATIARELGINKGSIYYICHE